MQKQIWFIVNRETGQPLTIPLSDVVLGPFTYSAKEDAERAAAKTYFPFEGDSREYKLVGIREEMYLSHLQGPLQEMGTDAHSINDHFLPTTSKGAVWLDRVQGREFWVPWFTHIKGTGQWLIEALRLIEVYLGGSDNPLDFRSPPTFH